MPPGNRLAPVSQNAFGAPPTLAEIQLAARTAQRPSPLTLGERAQEINYGLGRGFTNILQGNLDLAQALYQDPRAVGKQMLEGYGQLLAHPVDTVNNSLRSMWNRAKSSPAGFGEVAGENINPLNWLKPRKAMRQELDVYHGTPHTFEPEEGAPLGRFRSEKIGTGEGAQAYGYGLYLAEDKRVGEGYRSTLSNFEQPYIKFGNKKIAGNQLSDTDLEALKYLEIGQRNAGQFLHNTVYYAKQAAANKPEVLQRLEEFGRDVKFGYEKNKGALYKVDLPDAKIKQMLDWDKPLSQQPKSILNVAQSVANDVPDGIVAEILREEGIKGFASGGDLYRSIAQDLGSDSYASQALLTEGKIPGIKYLDAGSRDGGKGTRNFVVFPGEEQHLNILSRD